MSPSTTIMEFLAAHDREFGIIVEQTEDEIGGINMALGASYAGVRAMTATSGGGFALMVEGLGLSGISETPIIIVICSRPGPATGFPTRTEQADLLFALHAGQDEFPRFIFAPGTAEQAFYLTNKAFDLSRKYQVPAIILSDQLLSDSYATVDDFDLSRLATNLEGDIPPRSVRILPSAHPYTYQRLCPVRRGLRPPPARNPRPDCRRCRTRAHRGRVHHRISVGPGSDDGPPTGQAQTHARGIGRHYRISSIRRPPNPDP